jgi:hypothetical protein
MEDKKVLVRYVGSQYCNQHLLTTGQVYEMAVLGATVAIYGMDGKQIGEWYKNDCRRMFKMIK